MAGGKTVRLDWIASVDVVDGYNVYRGSVAGGPYTKLNTALVTGLTFTDPNPALGSNFYVLRASRGGIELCRRRPHGLTRRTAAVGGIDILRREFATLSTNPWVDQALCSSCSCPHSICS